MTALHFAAQNNNAAVINYLIDVKGFDINSVDAKGSTATHWAVFHSHDLALSFLLAKNPNIDQ